jgi:hypothetical protein
MSTSIDSWDEVWDDYEARRALSAPAAQLARSRLARRRGRPIPVAALALVTGLACLAGYQWPAIGLYALVLRQDMPGVLRQVDFSPARDGLRQAMLVHAGLGPADTSAAARLLTTMATEMSAALTQPGALEQVVLARGGQPGGWPSRDPAAVALPRLGLARLGLAQLGLAGLAGISLDLGPASGQGGFGLNLVWRDGGWQAAAVTLLDPPVSGGRTSGRLAQAEATAPAGGGALAVPRQPPRQPG